MCQEWFNPPCDREDTVFYRGGKIQKYSEVVHILCLPDRLLDFRF